MPLPPLYDRWITQLLGAALPEEAVADCAHCPMCESDTGNEGLLYSFNPETRCCTFLPELPNFLLGGALGDSSAEGRVARESILARLARQGGATPLGLGRPASYPLARPAAAFGRPQSPACDHYLEGICAVWSHRESTCATWFCKHERGAVGRRLWQETAQLLAAVERALARWCALELGIDARVLAALVTPSGPAVFACGMPRRPAEELGCLIGPSERRGAARGPELFGAHAGAEEAYFCSCAQLVGAMEWDEVCRICGPDARLFAESLRHHHQDLASPAIPKRLCRGRYNVEVVSSGEALLSAYSPLDPILLPAPILEVLARFDGAPTEEVLRRISAELDLEIDTSLLQQLVDFAILVPCEAG